MPGFIQPPSYKYLSETYMRQQGYAAERTWNTRTKQLTDAKEWEARTLAAKNAKEKELAANKATLASMTAAYKLPSSDGGTSITGTEQTTLNNYGSLYIAPLITEVNTLKQKYTDAVAARKAAEKAVSDITANTGGNKALKNYLKNNKTHKSKKSSSEEQKPFGYSPVTFKYNAPMVSWAYLSSKGPQQGVKVYVADGEVDENKSKVLSRSVGAPIPTDRGEYVFQNEFSSKGVLQMNTQFNSTTINSMGTNAKYDDKLYGFRFLYNPKEVSMTWGLAEGVNWEAVQTGLDKSTPVSTGLLNSTISFSLLLNRMADMQYLDSNGLRADVANPYPINVDKTDLAAIYKRGTMYDIEYLFKTIMGVNATYNSGLNGLTADKGWLNGTPIDLHLGDGLRYQVRIGSLDVAHTIFNDRMVPILSTINITCHRFYDLLPSTTNDSATRRGDRGAINP